MARGKVVSRSVKQLAIFSLSMLFDKPLNDGTVSFSIFIFIQGKLFKPKPGIAPLRAASAGQFTIAGAK